MLQYKSKLLQASFRGVSFGIRDITTTIGRRTALHEYPLRNEPYAEDLGRKARIYNVSAFVMCPNDFTQAEALLSALEDNSAPGTFIHPSLGSRTVMVQDSSHNFNNQEGGIVYFNMTFVETLGNNFPNVTTDTQSQIRLAVNSLLDTSSNYFAQNFNTVGYPDFIGQSAITNLNAFSTKFRGLINVGSAQNGNPSNYSRLINRLNNFNDDIPTLITEPSKLASTITNLISDFNASFTGNYGLAMLLLARLFEYGDGFLIIVPITNLREVQLTNQNQVIYLIRNATIAMMVRNIGQNTFESADDAIAARDSVDDKAWSLQRTLANNFDDDIYQALSNVLAAMVADIRVRSMNSATTRTFKIADAMPALVLAYEFLEDARQDTSLANRNKVANPLFVPANSDVKVVVPNV